MSSIPSPLSPETALLLQEHGRYTSLSARIGNTPFYEHPDLAELFQVKHLWIKDESTNLTGTVKDRKSLEFLNSTPNDCGYITITNGNMGYSLGTIIGDRSRVISIVDQSTNAYNKEKLNEVSIVVERDLRNNRLTQEDLDDITGKFSGPDRQKWIFDMETHFNNPYHGLMQEIALDLQKIGLLKKNISLVVPLGGGELMSSCLSHLLSCVTGHTLYRQWNFYHTIGVTERENFSTKISRRMDYDTVHWPIEQKEYLADKLVTSYISATTKRTITHARKHGRATIVSIPSEDILRAYALLHQHNIKVEPSSAAAFAGVWQLKDKPEHVIVINTGEGVYDKTKQL